MSSTRERRVTFFGQYPPSAQRSLQVSEEIAAQLPPHWATRLCSRRAARWTRLADQFRVAATCRDDVCVVNLFGGRSFWPAATLVALLERRRRVTVLHLHGGSLPQLARRHPTGLRRTLNRATAVIAPSAYLTRSLAPLRPDIEVIPNGVHVDRYASHPEPWAHGSPRTILWLRSFHPIYNPRLALRAFSGVLRQMPELRLSMIGTVLDPQELAATRRLMRELQLEAHVSIGEGISKQDVAEVMRTAHVFLNTTNVDNAPVTLIEAMASGLPVVSTDVGGISDLVRHGVTGLLTKADSAQDLAAALLGVLRDPALAAKLGEHARLESQRYSWEEIMPQWVDLFDRLGTTARRKPAQGAAA